MMITELTT